MFPLTNNPNKSQAIVKILNMRVYSEELLLHLHLLIWTRLRKCSFFEWKDEEQEDGYYKNLLYSLKQKLDAKDEMSEMNKLRRRIVEVVFLLSQEQYKVAKSEKEVHDARKAIGRYRMIVALLFACLALCVLKLGGQCS
ncbi:unnamed protein product [Lactuca saligna]|uniref:Uncharacterized protein n=1 Tax=Lactuca saligna TaxID=75948 RepID=A0AA35VS06_LACSI|nr:unnamed protein product [Lactuca saligna]